MQKVYYDIGASEQSETDNLKFDDDLGIKGLIGGFLLGYYKFFNDFNLGLEYLLNISNAKGHLKKIKGFERSLLTDPLYANGGIVQKAKLENAFYLRCGYKVLNYLPYIKIGFSAMKFSHYFTSYNSYKKCTINKTKIGFATALGIEVPLPFKEKISLDLQGNLRIFSRYTLKPFAENYTIKPVIGSVTLGIKYYF